MFFIYGTKKFGIKRDAYKATNCDNCEMPRVCIRHGWFEWGHLFWIPLIPLGYNYTWECSACGKEPKTFRETTIGAKIFSLLFVSFVTFAIFTTPNIKMDANLLIGVKIFLTFVLAWMGYWIVRHAERRKEKELKNVLRIENLNECHLCNGKLTQSLDRYKYQCSDCKCVAITNTRLNTEI